MYGCESWTIKKAEHWRIDAFELWCWRRLLRVPWTARRSNQSILKISPGCSLEGLMLKLKLQYFGYLMWRADSLEKTLMLGKIKGGRRGANRWDGWMASLTGWTWVCTSSRSWWWTGKPGVLQSTGLQRVDSLEKTLMLGGIGVAKKGTTEDEMVGWHHWLDGRESEWTSGVGNGQGGLECCNSWVTESWTRLSNWNEKKKGFPCSSVSKESVCNAKDLGSIPGLGRFPGEGNGNPLQYPWLENLMDRGAWWAAVHGVAQNWAQLSD